MTITQLRKLRLSGKRPAGLIRITDDRETADWCKLFDFPYIAIESFQHLDGLDWSPLLGLDCWFVATWGNPVITDRLAIASAKPASAKFSLYTGHEHAL